MHNQKELYLYTVNKTNTKKSATMYYIATFNADLECSENITFDTLKEAMVFASDNGYKKVRDQKGGEYHV